MGNRAVITTKHNFYSNGVGVYLHWNGGRTSVECFLKYCQLKGYRSPETDCYGWARLCQVIGNFFGGDVSVGVDIVQRLDCDNGDNGTYLIEDWEIVGRKYENDEDYDRYDKTEFLIDIDESMPENEQLGRGFIQAREVAREEIRVGDVIYDKDWQGKVFHGVCVGYKEGACGTKIVNYPVVKAEGYHRPLVLRKEKLRVANNTAEEGGAYDICSD